MFILITLAFSKLKVSISFYGKHGEFHVQKTVLQLGQHNKKERLLKFIFY